MRKVNNNLIVILKFGLFINKNFYLLKNVKKVKSYLGIEESINIKLQYFLADVDILIAITSVFLMEKIILNAGAQMTCFSIKLLKNVNVFKKTHVRVNFD